MFRLKIRDDKTRNRVHVHKIIRILKMLSYY